MAAVGTFTGFDGAGSGEDLEVFAPIIWSSRVNMFFEAKLALASFFMNVSDEVSSGAIQVNIPNFSEPTPNLKANGSAVTLNSPTETNVNLVVDTWYECSYFIEKKEMHQVANSYNFQSKLAKAAGYAVAKQLDTALAALFSGFSNTVGGSTHAVVDSDIRRAIRTLDANNVDDEGRAFFFHPFTLWEQVMAVDAYVSGDYMNQKAIAGEGLASQRGSLYGIPVVQTTQVPLVDGSYVNALAQKDALVWASLYNVGVDSNYIPMYMGQLVTADITYGVIENRNIAGFGILSND